MSSWSQSSLTPLIMGEVKPNIELSNDSLKEALDSEVNDNDQNDIYQ